MNVNIQDNKQIETKLFQEDNVYKIVYLGISFSFLQCAYGSLQEFLILIMEQENLRSLANSSLGILYFAFCLSEFFFSPFMFSIYKGKQRNILFGITALAHANLCFSFGIVVLCRESYCTAFYCNLWFLYIYCYLSSILCGISGSIMWLTQGIYMCKCTRPWNRGRFSGLFFLIFNTSLLSGNFMGYYILRNGYVIFYYIMLICLCCLSSLMLLLVRQPIAPQKTPVGKTFVFKKMINFEQNPQKDSDLESIEDAETQKWKLQTISHQNPKQNRSQSAENTSFFNQKTPKNNQKKQQLIAESNLHLQLHTEIQENLLSSIPPDPENDPQNLCEQISPSLLRPPQDQNQNPSLASPFNRKQLSPNTFSYTFLPIQEVQEEETEIKTEEKQQDQESRPFKTETVNQNLQKQSDFHRKNPIFKLKKSKSMVYSPAIQQDTNKQEYFESMLQQKVSNEQLGLLDYVIKNSRKQSQLSQYPLESELQSDLDVDDQITERQTRQTSMAVSQFERDVSKELSKIKNYAQDGEILTYSDLMHFIRSNKKIRNLIPGYIFQGLFFGFWQKLGPILVQFRKQSKMEIQYKNVYDETGFVFVICGIVQFIFGPIFGFWYDRASKKNKRRIMILLLTISVITILIFPLPFIDSDLVIHKEDNKHQAGIIIFTIIGVLFGLQNSGMNITGGPIRSWAFSSKEKDLILSFATFRLLYYFSVAVAFFMTIGIPYRYVPFMIPIILLLFAIWTIKTLIFNHKF